MSLFEDMTYENLLDSKLEKVDNQFDKREGSIIYDAIAPNSAETAQAYIALDWIFEQMFGDTAEREYLIKIADDTRGLKPYEATHAVLKGEFDVQIKIGERFNLESINYKVIKAIAEPDDSGSYLYQLECESAGVIGNKYFGTLIPMEYIQGLTHCELVELLVPGEDEEDTESFRKRWRKSFNASAFGGNKTDYIEKISSIEGVGGCKCYRGVNAAGGKTGGHVKCVVIASDYSVPSDTLIQNIQTIIDPEVNKGEGNGLAPIGHEVHICGVTPSNIDISISIEYESGYTFADLKSSIEKAVDKYFETLRKEWSEAEQLVVKRLPIETAISEIDGIIDANDTLLNGKASNIILDSDNIPIRGDIIG